MLQENHFQQTYSQLQYADKNIGILIVSLFTLNFLCPLWIVGATEISSLVNHRPSCKLLLPLVTGSSVDFPFHIQFHVVNTKNKTYFNT